MLIRVEYPENGLYTCISPEVRKRGGVEEVINYKDSFETLTSVFL